MLSFRKSKHFSRSRVSVGCSLTITSQSSATLSYPQLGVTAVFIFRVACLIMFALVLFHSPPAGSPDPRGLPDLECKERFGQRVPEPAFSGQHPDATVLKLTPCSRWLSIYWLSSCIFIFISVQVCHIVLGLRPATPEEEGQIIRYVPVLATCPVIVWLKGPICDFLLCVCV